MIMESIKLLPNEEAQIEELNAQCARVQAEMGQLRAAYLEKEDHLRMVHKVTLEQYAQALRRFATDRKIDSAVQYNFETKELIVL